ncbi:hypothetical protein ADUPG1_002298, partial [Aduncisulcus paluster]
INVSANVDLESVSLSATSSSLTTLYATNTKIDNILTLALPVLMEHLSIGGQSSTSTSSLDDTNVLAVIESLTKLVELRISSSNLAVIPDLSNSASSLVKLYIDGNPAIRSLYPSTNASLLKLTTLDASSCSISDVSALFPLPLLLSIDLSSNKIWAGTGSQSTLEANFVKHSDTNFALDISSQDSECSLSIDAFTANKVCSSTTPTS